MSIKGNTVGTPMPRSNFNQTDPSKADYIRGRENIASKDDVGKAIGNIKIPTVPTKVSAFANDANYATEEYVDKASIVNTAEGEAIAVHDSAVDRSLQGLKIYGKTTQTDTGYANVGDSGSVNVKVNGKNFLSPSYYRHRAGSVIENDGITYTFNEDGTILLNGKATNGGYYAFITKPSLFLPAGNYRCSFNAPELEKTPDDGQAYYTQLWVGEQKIYDRGKGGPFSLTENTKVTQYLVSIKQGVILNNVLLKPMIELGNVSTSYEEPKEAQTLTVLTPDGLASVGDVCDEIDFAKGVFIQKIARGEEYTVLETPIETPLSAEQIEAFKALYTNYPNTSITNDSGAHMEVEYVVDTKTYVDNNGGGGGGGADGYTPIKGVDYFTEEDVQEIVDEVCEKIGDDAVDTETIAAAVDKYMSENPIDIPTDYVKSVNGKTPDEKGNVEVSVGGGAIPRIEISDSVATLEPNKFYVFPEMSTLTIVFGGTVSNEIVQEYKFRFISGATATTLILPQTVNGDITINANSVVEVSIIDGYAVSQSWAVS